MHLTRKESSIKLPIKRKGSKYLVRAASYLGDSVPVLIAVRDMLKLAKTCNEVKKIIHAKSLKLNGRTVKDYHESIKLFNIFEADKPYLLSILPTGKFILTELKNKSSRPCKIINKKLMGKNLFQMHLHEGSNILTKDNLPVGDSLYLDLAGKVVKHISLEKGSKVFVMSGRHIGKEGEVESFSDNRVSVKFKEGSAQVEKSRVIAL